LKERKDKVLIEDVERFAVSFDGSKLLYEGEGHLYGIIDAKPPDQPKKVVRALCRLEACARKLIRRRSGNKSSTKSGGRSVTSFMRSR